MDINTTVKIYESQQSYSYDDEIYLSIAMLKTIFKMQTDKIPTTMI